MSDSLQPNDCSLPGSSVHGILQAGILEWLPFLTPGHLPDPGMETACLACPTLAGEFFTTEPHEGVCTHRDDITAAVSSRWMLALSQRAFSSPFGAFPHGSS